MEKDTTLYHSSRKSEIKTIDFRSQKKTFFEFLRHYTATASMAAAATGIPQKNLCRFKRQLQGAGLLWEVKRSNCRVTGFKAWYLTTNADLPFQQQLKLF